MVYNKSIRLLIVIYINVPTAKFQFAMPMPMPAMQMPMPMPMPPMPMPMPPMPMIQVPFLSPNPGSAMIAEIKFRKIDLGFGSEEREEKEKKIREEKERVEREQKERAEREEREKQERDGSKIELHMSPVLMLMQPSMMAMPGLAMPPPMPPPMLMPRFPPIGIIRPAQSRPVSHSNRGSEEMNGKRKTCDHEKHNIPVLRRINTRQFRRP